MNGHEVVVRRPLREICLAEHFPRLIVLSLEL